MNLAFDDAILFHRATGVRYSFRGTSQKSSDTFSAPSNRTIHKGDGGNDPPHKCG